MVPFKSLYFESDSKRLEPGEKYTVLYGKFSVFNLSYFSPFYYIHLKLSTRAYFEVRFHSMLSKYENSENRFCGVLTNEFH